ncbi:tyrosine-type recombinase/integrase [Nonomuraea recticatena]|uniref:tyrosine-type recombinase/integrase n=1 Tax=Nonomuraea recticatena TaxID=46178 RepID=UPI00361FECD7
MLEPSALLPPGRVAAATPVGPLAPHARGSAAPPPAPLVASVGDIAGLRPRRARRDGGEVPGADVDLVDALDRRTWSVVAAWLADSPLASTRQTRLQVLAAFLRWLQSLTPEVPLLAVTEDHLIAYRDAAGNGLLTVGVRIPGKPLAARTIAKLRNNLSSFYTYARRRKVIDANPATDVRAPRVSSEGSTEALIPAAHQQVREGIAKLAGQGHLAEAAVIALLDDIGARAGAVSRLTVGDIRTVTATDGSRHTVVRFINKGGKTVELPIASELGRTLMQRLGAGRAATELLFTRDDGGPIDRWWISAALTAAAIAGGMPAQEAAALHPHMLRATTITELLDAGARPEEVQAAAQHASIETTFRYKGRNKSLIGHVLYRRQESSESS